VYQLPSTPPASVEPEVVIVKSVVLALVATVMVFPAVPMARE
jgi:hypothetical protein